MRAMAPVETQDAALPQVQPPDDLLALQRIVSGRSSISPSPGTVHIGNRNIAEGFRGPACSLPHLGVLQRAFGEHDLSRINAYVGGSAADTCAAHGANALTAGERVAFAAAPDLRMAAHEAAHVVQQRHGVDLPSGFGRPGDVYERNAAAVAAAVAAGRPAADLLAFPEPHAVRSVPAVQFDATTVKRGGGTYTVIAGDFPFRIAEKLYGYGHYWKYIRDANPSLVRAGRFTLNPGNVIVIPEVDVPILEALHGARNDAARGQFARSIDPADYEAFIQALDAGQRDSEASFLQQVEVMRSSGKTIAELGAEQRRFLEEEAKKGGISPGEVVKKRLDDLGYGDEPEWWSKLTFKEKAEWKQRFRGAVKNVRAAATPDILKIIQEAEARGGGFQWNPTGGGYGSTRVDFILYVGKEWVENAEQDPTSVFANIAHELSGHNRYGPRMFGNEVIKGALKGLSAAERKKAQSSKNFLTSAYGYMETEIFAELYEAAYDRADNPTDHPFVRDAKTGKFTDDSDVVDKLREIRQAFAPVVAEAIVRGLWRRVQLDARIRDVDRQGFVTAVEKVFHIKLL